LVGGFSIGLDDGWEVGLVLGFCVGFAVGWKVVGFCVGFAVGWEVGLVVGCCVGLTEGLDVKVHWLQKGPAQAPPDDRTGLALLGHCVSRKIYATSALVGKEAAQEHTF
jgi:hypothetical protein